MKQANADGPFIAALTCIITHAIFSSIYVYYDSKHNQRKLRAFLQTFNGLIVLEVWNSMQLGRQTFEMQQLRILEGCLESAPQALIQLYYILRYGEGFQDSIVILSVTLSMLSISTIATSADFYGTRSYKVCGKKIVALPRILNTTARSFEIGFRCLIVSVAMFHTSTRIIFGYVLVSTFLTFSIVLYFQFHPKSDIAQLEESDEEPEERYRFIAFSRDPTQEALDFNHAKGNKILTQYTTIYNVRRPEADQQPGVVRVLFEFPSLCIDLKKSNYDELMSAYNQLRESGASRKYLGYLDKQDSGYVIWQDDGHTYGGFRTSDDFSAPSPAVSEVSSDVPASFGYSIDKLKWKHLRVAFLAVFFLHPNFSTPLFLAINSLKILEMTTFFTISLVMTNDILAKYVLAGIGCFAIIAFLLFRFAQDFDMEMYTNVQQTNVKHLFRVKEYQIILRLIDRKEIGREDVIDHVDELTYLKFTIEQGDGLNFKMADYKKFGFSCKQLRDYGFGIMELLNDEKGFSVAEICEAQFSASDFYSNRIAPRLLEAQFTVPDLQAAGYSIKDLRDNGFECKKIYSELGPSAHIKDLLKAGFSDKEIREAGVSVATWKTEISGISPFRLKRAGYGVAEMSPHYRIKELHSRIGKLFSLREIMESETPYEIKEFLDSGFSVQELQPLLSDCPELELFKLGLKWEQIISTKADKLNVSDLVKCLPFVNQFWLSSAQKLLSCLRRAKIDLDTKDPQALGLIELMKAVIGEPDNGETALFWAIHMYQPSVVDILIHDELDLEATHNHSLEGSYLILACRKGSDLIVQKLIEKGADIEAKTNNGRTPLIWASVAGHASAVDILIEARANLEAKDNYRQNTAFQWASSKGHDSIARTLLDAGADFRWNVMVNDDVHAMNEKEMNTALLWSLREGFHETVGTLIDAKCSLECKYADGTTPLIRAVKEGKNSILEKLIHANANLEAKNSERVTSLILAIEAGENAAIKMLIDGKADVGVFTRDKQGRTALMMAMERGEDWMVKALVDAKADLEAKHNNDGTTVLTQAIRQGNNSAIKILIDGGADFSWNAQFIEEGIIDLESKDKDKQTAKIWASQNNEQSAIQKLISAAVNLEAEDHNGYPKKEVAKYFPSSRPTNLETRNTFDNYPFGAEPDSESSESYQVRNTFDINPFAAEPDSESSKSYQVQRAITFTRLTVSPASTNMVPRESSTHTPKTDKEDHTSEAQLIRLTSRSSHFSMLNLSKTLQKCGLTLVSDVFNVACPEIPGAIPFNNFEHIRSLIWSFAGSNFNVHFPTSSATKHSTLRILQDHFLGLKAPRNIHNIVQEFVGTRFFVVHVSHDLDRRIEIKAVKHGAGNAQSKMLSIEIKHFSWFFFAEAPQEEATVAMRYTRRHELQFLMCKSAFFQSKDGDSVVTSKEAVLEQKRLLESIDEATEDIDKHFNFKHRKILKNARKAIGFIDKCFDSKVSFISQSTNSLKLPVGFKSPQSGDYEYDLEFKGSDKDFHVTGPFYFNMEGNVTETGVLRNKKPRQIEKFKILVKNQTKPWFEFFGFFGRAHEQVFEYGPYDITNDFLSGEDDGTLPTSSYDVNLCESGEEAGADVSTAPLTTYQSARSQPQHTSFCKAAGVDKCAVVFSVFRDRNVKKALVEAWEFEEKLNHVGYGTWLFGRRENGDDIPPVTTTRRHIEGFNKWLEVRKQRNDIAGVFITIIAHGYTAGDGKPKLVLQDCDDFDVETWIASDLAGSDFPVILCINSCRVIMSKRDFANPLGSLHLDVPRNVFLSWGAAQGDLAVEGDFITSWRLFLSDDFLRKPIDEVARQVLYYCKGGKNYSGLDASRGDCIAGVWKEKDSLVRTVLHGSPMRLSSCLQFAEMVLGRGDLPSVENWESRGVVQGKMKVVHTGPCIAVVCIAPSERRITGVAYHGPPANHPSQLVDCIDAVEVTSLGTGIDVFESIQHFMDHTQPLIPAPNELTYESNSYFGRFFRRRNRQQQSTMV